MLPAILLAVALLSAARPCSAEADPMRILIFGDSITAGYGLDPEQAFPAVIQRKVDRRGWEFEVINAGLSGETSAGGLRRIDWVLQRPVDLFILELGGNDGLRGLDPDHTRDNLQSILDRVRERYPDARLVLTGMEAPPNMGRDYTDRFRTIYRELADRNELHFLPFILEGVAGEPELNQADGIHPTEEGHRIVAENLWELLEPLLESMLRDL